MFVASQSSGFFLCSREQVRAVENRLNCVEIGIHTYTNASGQRPNYEFLCHIFSKCEKKKELILTPQNNLPILHNFLLLRQVSTFIVPVGFSLMTRVQLFPKLQAIKTRNKLCK